jgi:NAD+ kinase
MGHNGLSSMSPAQEKPLRTLLYGPDAGNLRTLAEKHVRLELVDSEPDVVVCYGGDGTLLSAELQWPGVPKVPIRNSRRGLRLIPRPPSEVLDRLARGDLVRTTFLKLECTVSRGRNAQPPECSFTAVNEFNVDMGRINSAVRFKLWVDEEPFDGGREIIGDGFVVSTPFGSTAYYNKITRGVFYTGLGVAFKSTNESVDHLVVQEDAMVRFLLTRGPAVLAFDNCQHFTDLEQGDVLAIRKHANDAVILTWGPMSHPSDRF